MKAKEQVLWLSFVLGKGACDNLVNEAVLASINLQSENLTFHLSVVMTFGNGPR